MAIIKCPDCQHEVSDQAEKCPNCGRAIKKSQSATGVVAAIIIGLIAGYALMKILGFW